MAGKSYGRASPPLLHQLRRDKRRATSIYAIAYYSHFWNFQVDIMRAAFESHPQHLRIRVHYEDLRQNPVSAIGALFHHLGRKIVPDELLKLAERTRIESFPPSARGPDKSRQSGVVGGYRDFFDDDEIATMNAIIGTKPGPIWIFPLDERPRSSELALRLFATFPQPAFPQSVPVPADPDVGDAAPGSAAPADRLSSSRRSVKRAAASVSCRCKAWRVLMRSSSSSRRLLTCPVVAVI